MGENNALTHYSVTIRFTDHPGHFEPEILARSPGNAARIALWRLRPEYRQTTVALTVSAPINPPAHFPAYEGQPHIFVRDAGRRTLAAASESRLLQLVDG